MDELIQRFNLEGISGGNAVFNTEKLDWFNHQHLLRLDDAALIALLMPWFDEAGYLTIGLDVVALDSDKSLAAAAREAGIETVVGDLDKGWDKGAPYDLILLDGAVEEIPAALVKQLRDGGRLAGATVERGVSRLVIGRAAGGVLGLRSIADAEVESLPGLDRPRAFTF